MEVILYLIIGLAIGGFFGYFIYKLILQKNFVTKADLFEAEKKISDLQLQNAIRLSKEEVDTNFVSRRLYENINANLTTANQNLEEQTKANKENQGTILRLTAESEQKLTKAEV